jgi:hypothetical protein
MSAGRREGGFTLVELVLAVGLLSLLMLALFQLVDTSTTIWRRTDTNRELGEMGSALLDRLAADVHALEGGPQGDLMADWVLVDLDRDGIDGMPRQRLRLVRHLDAAGLRSLAGDRVGPLEIFDRGLVEVVWALLPSSSTDPDERAQGVLVRGVRVPGDDQRVSVFEPGFFGPGGKPLPGAVDELTGGVLWFEVWFATQTTILHQGWNLGDEVSDCAASWDAWRKARPNAEVSILNQEPIGVPEPRESPLLPRRVRVTLELERPIDLRQRTRLALELTDDAHSLRVRDGRKIPVGSMILLDDEWLKVRSVEGDTVVVERGQRATRPALHKVGTLVHHGARAVRELVIDMTREDWNL